MFESDPHVPNLFRSKDIVTCLEEHDAAKMASRMIEFLLATGGPQANFGAVTNLIAAELANFSLLSAEIRRLGQDVASLNPSTFARLQGLAWADCQEAIESAR